mgnify:CR=1 FL=1
MGLGEAFATHVGVDLGGGDVGVTEHFLDRAQVGTVVEQVSGERGAQHMGRDVLSNVRGTCGLFNDLL